MSELYLDLLIRIKINLKLCLNRLQIIGLIKDIMFSNIKINNYIDQITL